MTTETEREREGASRCWAEEVAPSVVHVGETVTCRMKSMELIKFGSNIKCRNRAALCLAFNDTFTPYYWLSYMVDEPLILNLCLLWTVSDFNFSTA